LPLPAMSAGQPMPGQGYGAQQGFDTTGQVAPPGMKPRVTATLWEDEGSLCFQVEAKGVCVARREGMSAYSTQIRNALTGNYR
jgi:protein SOK2